MDNNLYCIIEISGGLGKNIIATTLVRSIKKTYPNYKIIIITGWCEPFYNNINVYKLFHFNEARYIFDDYVNENTKIFALEVYKSQNYVLRKKHLSECWTSLYSDLIYDGNKPDIILNPRELEIAKDKFKPNDKKVFAIQMNGGSDAGNGGQYSKKS